MGMLSTKRILPAVLLMVAMTSCNRACPPKPPSPPDPNLLAMAPPETADYPQDGVLLGTGWDSISGRPTKSICIAFAEASPKGQDVTLKLEDVVDNSTIMEQLNISASLQVKAIAGSGSAKTEFARTTSVRDDSAYFTAHALVLNGVRFVSPVNQRVRFDKDQQLSLVKLLKPGSAATMVVDPQSGARVDLTSDYQKLAKRNPAEFRKECGDLFVSAIHEGAELDAVLKFNEHESKKRQTLTSSIEGSYQSVSLNATVSTVLDEYQKNHKLGINYHLVGGVGTSVPTDKQGLVDAIANVAKAAEHAPYPFTVTLEHYETLPALSREGVTTAARYYQGIAGQYARYKTLYDQIEYIKQNSTEYVFDRGVSLNGVRAVQDQVKTHLDSIANTAGTCIKNSANEHCQLLAEDSVDDYEFRVKMPARKGFPEDKDRDDAISNVERIKADIVRYDNQYRNGNGIGEKVVGGVYAEQRRRELPPAQQSLDQINAAYPTALKKVILYQWITEPVSSRCKKSPHSPGCLKNDRIDELEKKIVTE